MESPDIFYNNIKLLVDFLQELSDDYDSIKNCIGIQLVLAKAYFKRNITIDDKITMIYHFAINMEGKENDINEGNTKKLNNYLASVIPGNFIDIDSFTNILNNDNIDQEDIDTLFAYLKAYIKITKNYQEHLLDENNLSERQEKILEVTF